MARMKKAQLAKCRRHLQQVREELIAKIRRAYSNGRDEKISAEPSDSADLALSSYTKEFLYKLSDVERVQIVEVESALNRIDDGSYGECIDCGNPVPPRRLEIVPWACRCTACQELFEQSQQEDAREAQAEEAANF